MDKKAKNHFNTAKDNLKDANEELFKPEEDVVSYLVCKSSQQAIENYLKGYLSLRGFETNNDETLQSLLDRCKSLDSKFNHVDIETIDCKAHKMDSRYCQDVNKVSSCFDTADNLDTFLRKLKII
ncbi:MAG: HEPN domain-containing protein [Flavobacteriaceae bacterium]|nr:HEPN domain-containing protein [Flavobacteriaceae bacterium]